MPPGRNTAKAVCERVSVSACECVCVSTTILKFLTVLYLTTALPKADIHTAMEGNRKKMDSGLRAKMPSMVTRIPDWLIHSFGSPLAASVQAAPWPDR